MELAFKNVCSDVVPEAVRSEWMQNIREQYSEPHRFYHNQKMLESKLDLIDELAKNEDDKRSMILATFFQYYHYNVKKDYRQKNVAAFRLFIEQSGLKDVSFNYQTQSPELIKLITCRNR